MFHNKKCRIKIILKMDVDHLKQCVAIHYHFIGVLNFSSRPVQDFANSSTKIHVVPQKHYCLGI